MSEGLSYSTLAEALGQQSLFEDKSWRLSPKPWVLTPQQAKELEKIGSACLEFYRTTELLYSRSHSGKSLTRNGHLTAQWVADYYDRGKPDALIQHGRLPLLRRKAPVVIRPDLLLTEEGLALTEIDSVPGGIGLTAFLNQMYGQEFPVLGGHFGIIDGFYAAMAALRPDRELPLIVIVVSDEANTYRPEMEWLAEQCQDRGYRVHALHPGDLMPIGDAICADIDGNPEEVDVLYRFWELFDLENIPVAGEIIRLLQEGSPMAVTPPMKAFQEEKLSLALFHHPRLQEFWKESLSRSAFKVLQKAVPRGWVVDPTPVPPNAVLEAPTVAGRAITQWMDLADASQKERSLILKLSGFHENAWGARSVLFGSDASREEWSDGLTEAVETADQGLHILQVYRKPARLSHPVYRDEDTVYPMQGRVRLCPFYFVEGDSSHLEGVLATFCPADKKIIHGMRDAALIPAMVEEK